MRTKTSKNTCCGFNLISFCKTLLCFSFFVIISYEKAEAFNYNFIHEKQHHGKFEYTSFPDSINPIAYVLLWDSTKFVNWYKKNKGKKVIFRFYYTSDSVSKNLTIAGWLSDANDYFDDDPSVNNPDSIPDLEILKNKSTDSLDLSLRKYFFLGNIKISQWVLDRIKKGFKTYKFLLLKPVFDSDNHIVYEIYLQIENPKNPFAPAYKTVSPNANLIGRTDPSPPATNK